MELGLLWFWRGAPRPLFLPGCLANGGQCPPPGAGAGPAGERCSAGRAVWLQVGLAVSGYRARSSPGSSLLVPSSKECVKQGGNGMWNGPEPGWRRKALGSFCLDGVLEPCAVAALPPSCLLQCVICVMASASEVKPETMSYGLVLSWIGKLIQVCELGPSFEDSHSFPHLLSSPHPGSKAVFRCSRLGSLQFSGGSLPPLSCLCSRGCFLCMDLWVC